MDADSLTRSLEALGAAEPKIAAALERAGYPQPRVRPRGYETLLRTIIGQQVSVKAAASIWDKLAGIVGDVHVPAVMLAASDADLRAAGLSRQKAAYARSLAEHVSAGTLDLDALPEDDEEAIVLVDHPRGAKLQPQAGFRLGDHGLLRSVRALMLFPRDRLLKKKPLRPCFTRIRIL